LKNILNEEWIDEISEEFEKRAQKEYSKLYYKDTGAGGEIIKKFK